MGFLMKNGDNRWGYNDDKWSRDSISIGLQMTESFRKGLNFHKAGVSFKCWCCDEQKPKNTRYLCNGYIKVCVDCALKWIEESEKTMDNIKQMLWERKVELAENKKKWKKEQILGALEGGSE